MNDILMTVFLTLAVATMTFLLVLICMNLYEIFEEPHIQKRMKQLRPAVQPWVTVVLYARDNEATVEASMNALIKNNYKKYDVVVINDRSKDATLRRIHKFAKRHQKFPIAILNFQKTVTQKAVLEAAYKKSKRGEVVICLRAGTNVSSEFIKRAVATKGKKEIVSMRVYEANSTTTLSGIIRSLSNLFWLQSHTVFVSNPSTIQPVKLEVRLDFIAVVAFVGMLVVSILTKETMVIWYSWVIVTCYLFSVIWLQNEGLKTKIKLSFSAVSVLFLLPVASLIEGISQFRSRI